jgi:hypothetical protein
LLGKMFCFDNCLTHVNDRRPLTADGRSRQTRPPTNNRRQQQKT